MNTTGLELHYMPTPNGRKVTIMLEECGLEYTNTLLNIAAGDQYRDSFLAMNPNARMPLLVDHDAEGGPLPIFESGAILIYLGRKTGKFLPTDERGFNEVVQWVFWQMANQGPVAGHGNHFHSYAPEENTYAKTRFRREYRRLLAVMNYQLQRGEYLAGEYSIADMASFPWLFVTDKFDTQLSEFPHLQRWYEKLQERPALRRGMDVGRELLSGVKDFKPDAATRKLLFEQDDTLYAGRTPQPRQH